MPLLATTLIISAALAIINLWLGVRTSALRMAKKIMVGDGGDPQMIARMRAQANFIEYVPIALILMALIENRGGSGRLLWLIGLLLVLARLSHPFGMERPAPNPFRMFGVLGTWVATLALIGWAVKLAF